MARKTRKDKGRKRGSYRRRNSLKKKATKKKSTKKKVTKKKSTKKKSTKKKATKKKKTNKNLKTWSALIYLKKEKSDIDVIENNVEFVNKRHPEIKKKVQELGKKIDIEHFQIDYDYLNKPNMVQWFIDVSGKTNNLDKIKKEIKKIFKPAILEIDYQ